MKIPEKTIVNLKTGEKTDYGTIMLSEVQEKAALEFLSHVCETVKAKKITKGERACQT